MSKTSSAPSRSPTCLTPQISSNHQHAEPTCQAQKYPRHLGLSFFGLLLFPYALVGQGFNESDVQQIAALMERGQLNEAEARVHEALRTGPNSPVAYQLLGMIYQREKKFGPSEEALEKAADLTHHSDPRTLFSLLQTKFALKKTREATALVARISSLAEKDPAAHYSLGRLLRENSLSEDAARELEKARALSPQNPAITTELIITYLDAQKGQQAEALFRPFLETASYEDLMQAGSKFGEAHEFGTAARAFERAVTLQTSSYDASFDLAFAYYHQGDFARAALMLDRVRREDAEAHPDYHYLRGKIELGLNHGTAAGAEFLHALAQQPDNEALCLDAGLLFFGHENFWKSLEVFESCAGRLKDSAPIETGLALVYFRLGKYDDAIRTFKRVLSLRSDADAAREGLAFLLYVSGNLTEARSLLEPRLAAADADYYVHYLHALVLLRLEAGPNRSMALQSIGNALRRNPKFAPAYFQRGKIQAEQGALGRALEDLRRATELDPAYAQPYYLIAQIEFKLGNKHEAERARLRFTALDREKEEKDQKQQIENQLLQALQ